MVTADTPTPSRYAVLDGELVVNVVLWDGSSEWHPGDGLTLVDLGGNTHVGPGYVRRGKHFDPPAADELEPDAEPDAADAARAAARDRLAELRAHPAKATPAALLELLEALVDPPA